MSMQTEALFSKLYAMPDLDGMAVHADVVTREMLAFGMPYDLVDRTYGRAALKEKLPRTPLQFVLEFYGACTTARIWVGGRSLEQAWDGLDTNNELDESEHLPDQLRDWRDWLVSAWFPNLYEREWGWHGDDGYNTWIRLPFQSAAPLLMYYADRLNEEANQIPCGPRTFGAAGPAQLAVRRVEDLIMEDMKPPARNAYYKLRQVRLEQEDKEKEQEQSDDTSIEIPDADPN